MRISFKRTKSLQRILAVIILGAFFGCNNGNSDEGYVSVKGAQIYYKKAGSGAPLVVVHGGPVLSQHYLFPHLKPLSKDYELIFYDQRLSGRSSADVDTADITLDNLVDEIEGLRTSLNLDKIYLMGHSWGGFLAMKYAIKYPQHLKKLILADPMPASAKEWQREEIELAGRTTPAERKERQAILSSDAAKTNSPEVIEKLLLLSYKKMFYDTTLVDSLDLYIPDDYTKRSRLFGRLMPELQHYNLYPELADMQVPTLILYGSNEPAATLSGEKLDGTIPHSRLVIIKKSGHFPFIEQPAQFFSEINTFLKQ